MTQTKDVFPDDQSKIDAIDTLAGCFYVLAKELMNHVSVRDMPLEVSYHIGIGIQLLGAIIGKLDTKDFTPVNITEMGYDYEAKLEIVVDSLIRIRDKIRKRNNDR